jgi:hypothetical protein
MVLIKNGAKDSIPPVFKKSFRFIFVRIQLPILPGQSKVKRELFCVNLPLFFILTVNNGTKMNTKKSIKNKVV